MRLFNNVLYVTVQWFIKFYVIILFTFYFGSGGGLTSKHTPRCCGLGTAICVRVRVCPMLIYTQATSEWNDKEVCQRSAVSGQLRVQSSDATDSLPQWSLRQVTTDRQSIRPSSPTVKFIRNNCKKAE